MIHFYVCEQKEEKLGTSLLAYWSRTKERITNGTIGYLPIRLSNHPIMGGVTSLAISARQYTTVQNGSASIDCDMFVSLLTRIVRHRDHTTRCELSL